MIGYSIGILEKQYKKVRKMCMVFDIKDYSLTNEARNAFEAFSPVVKSDVIDYFVKSEYSLLDIIIQAALAYQCVIKKAAHSASVMYDMSLKELLMHYGVHLGDINTQKKVGSP